MSRFSWLFVDTPAACADSTIEFSMYPFIAEKNRDEEDCAGRAATSSDFSTAAAATSDRLFRLKIIAQVQLQIELH